MSIQKYHVSKNKSLVDNINNSLSNQYYKDVLVCENMSQGQYTLSFTDYTGGTTHRFSIGVGTSTYQTDIGMSEEHEDGYQSGTFTITAANAGKNLYVRFVRYLTPTTVSYTISNIMLNAGSTPLPYEPFETDNLLSDVLTGCNIKSDGTILVNQPYDVWIAAVSSGETYTASNVNGTYGFFTEKPTTSSTTYDNSRELFSGDAVTFTVPQGVSYVGIRANPDATNVMLNKGSTVLPYTPYGTIWKDIPYRRYETATDTVTSLPVKLYTDEQPITTWSMDGNTETSGTPSPSSPITIEGVGNKTSNLLNYNRQRSNTFKTDENYYIYGGVGNSTNVETSASNVSISISNNNISVYSRSGYGIGYIVEVQPNTTYTLSFDTDLTLDNKSYAALNLLTEDLQFDTMQTIYDKTYSFMTNNTTKYVYIVLRVVGETCIYSNLMLNLGSPALPYEPYGYEITISSSQTALTPMYLTEPLMKIGDYADTINSDGTVTRKIKKVEFDGTENWQNSSTGYHGFYLYMDAAHAYSIPKLTNSPLYCNIAQYTTDMTNYQTLPWYCVSDTSFGISTDTSVVGVGLGDWKQFLEDQYAAGTPLTVWYVLATPTTETVTVPTIPTTGGEVSIDIDTTVKPSEMSLTYHGWHEHEPLNKSKNLLTTEGAENGYLKADGTFVTPHDNLYTSDYLLIPTETTQITQSYNGDTMGTPAMCFYDSTKTFISGVAFGGDTTKTFDIPVNAVYFRTCYRSTSTWCMVNSGSTALPYAPYWK